jgi:hypothetical protein
MGQVKAIQLCAVCGADSELPPSGAFSLEGVPDHDTRPEELDAHALTRWIQRCQACGYCAHNLQRAVPGVAEVIRSDEYRALAFDPVMPPTAQKFLRYAYISDRTDRLRDAFWARVHAAWACDDAGLDALASECRRAALQMVEGESAGRFTVLDDAEFVLVVLADLHRRAGNFDMAIRYADRALRKKPSKPVYFLLHHEREFAFNRDRKCYSMEMQERDRSPKRGRRGGRALPEDDPIYKQGWIVGHTEPGAIPAILAARARAKSLQERASITAFDVAPRIYCIRVWSRDRAATERIPDTKLTGPEAIVEAATQLADGVVYLWGSDTIIFGFPDVPAQEALARALTIRRQCQRQAQNGVEISLSASTWGLSKWKGVLSAPWNFLNSAELDKALREGVGFNRVEPA